MSLGPMRELRARGGAQVAGGERSEQRRDRAPLPLYVCFDIQNFEFVVLRRARARGGSSLANVPICCRSCERLLC